MQDSTLSVPAGFPKMNADSDVASTNSKVIVARSYASLFSTVEDDISARDVVGHGTATAMAAAGAKNTGPLGPIQGVAPKAYLGSYKVLGASGSGTTDIILKAVDDAVKDGMDVISASISSQIAAPRLEDDVEADVQGGGAIGGVIYASPDNPLGSMNVGAATLPALMISNADGVAIKKGLASTPLTVRMDFAIASIAAPSDAVADFSSKGPNVNGAIKPDLVAVGTDFYTATESTVTTGELYGSTAYVITDGTSFSAPLVAGAAALLKAARPGLTAAQYRSLLINTAAPITAPVQEAGARMLDMNAALQSTFAVAPTSLSLGIGGTSPNLSKTLTISNVGAAAESYSLTVAPRTPGTIAPALGISTVTVQPGQSANVPVTFAASGLATGSYEGFVKIRGTASGIEGRVPYWYGIASDVPDTITALFIKSIDEPTEYKAGTRINNAIYFRVTDPSGIVIPNVQATVTAFSGGGSVVSTVSLDRNLPGVYSVSVQLGIRRGDNVFRITVGGLDPLEITIAGT